MRGRTSAATKAETRQKREQADEMRHPATMRPGRSHGDQTRPSDRGHSNQVSIQHSATDLGIGPITKAIRPRPPQERNAHTPKTPMRVSAVA